METELIQLLKFADEAIGRYITFYLTGAAALAVFVMTEGYKKNFTWIGKALLTICLAAVAWNNWANLVYYHGIYNATVDAIQAAVDFNFKKGLAAFPDHDTVHALAGKDGALQHKPTLYVNIGHTAGGLAMLSLIWWLEVQGILRERIIKRWKQWRNGD